MNIPIMVIHKHIYWQEAIRALILLLFHDMAARLALRIFDYMNKRPFLEGFGDD